MKTVLEYSHCWCEELLPLSFCALCNRARTMLSKSWWAASSFVMKRGCFVKVGTGLSSAAADTLGLCFQLMSKGFPSCPTSRLSTAQTWQGCIQPSERIALSWQAATHSIFYRGKLNQSQTPLLGHDDVPDVPKLGAKSGQEESSLQATLSIHLAQNFL